MLSVIAFLGTWCESQSLVPVTLRRLLHISKFSLLLGRGRAYGLYIEGIHRKAIALVADGIAIVAV